MNALNIRPISAFVDNYIWLIDDGHEAILVDPGQAKPCLEALESKNLKLKHVLITHHHPDHTGGVKALLEQYPQATVIGFEEAKFQGIDVGLKEGQSIDLLGCTFQCLEVPGHTIDHVAFYSEIAGQPSLFCGDTLFSGGCGRLFEGTADQMFHSLAKLKALPVSTKIYCAHEYTMSNLQFAASLMPTNEDLAEYIQAATKLREQNLPTLPSTLDTELKINPFLRETDQEIIDNLLKLDYKDLQRPEQVFAATRQAKDNA